MKTFFSLVDRPPVSEAPPRGALTKALFDTLTSGQALAFPLNGDTYAVVRNRKTGTASSVARRVNARVRTTKSDDGLSLLIWLEPKTVSNGDGHDA